MLKRPVTDVVLKDGQHDREAHSLVDKGGKFRRWAARRAEGIGKTPCWSGAENDGWRLIKCRPKRPGLGLVTDTGHAG